MAALATDFTESCIFGHSGYDTDDLRANGYESITTFELSSSQKYLGENLAFSLGEFGIERRVQGWIDEGYEILQKILLFLTKYIQIYH